MKKILSKLLTADDANLSLHNIHGGVILKTMEEAGRMASLEYLSRNGVRNCQAALARIEKMNFEQPVKVGEVAHSYTKVTYAKNSTIEVAIQVEAEDLKSGTVRKTNDARMIFVTVEEDRIGRIPGFSPLLSMERAAGAKESMPPKLRTVKHPIPEFTDFSSPEEKRAAHERYEQLKRRIRGGEEEEVAILRRPIAPVLSHVILPSDCYPDGMSVYGGVTMKLMDSACGITAASYCKTNVVTASLDAMNFLSPIFLSNVLRVFAYPTFASARSLEMATFVEAEDVFTGQSWRACSAYLYFVSLGEDGRSLPIRPIEPKSHEERLDFAKGLARYNARKTKVG